MSEAAGTTLMAHSLAIAREQIGAREKPPGSNWGDEIAMFLESTGITTPAPWCAAFIYFCIHKASADLGIENPFRSLKHKAYTPSWLGWANEHGESLTGRKAKKLVESEAAPSVIEPGMLFLLYYPRLKRVGHIGFIASQPIEGGLISTIEGNTDPRGSRTGGGVFERTRKLAGIHRLVRY